MVNFVTLHVIKFTIKLPMGSINIRYNRKDITRSDGSSFCYPNPLLLLSVQPYPFT